MKIILVAAAVTVLAATPTRAAVSDQKPNIITSSPMTSAGRTSVSMAAPTSRRRISTPSRRAERSSRVQPMCTPTKAALMTGLTAQAVESDGHSITDEGFGEAEVH